MSAASCLLIGIFATQIMADRPLSLLPQFPQTRRAAGCTRQGVRRKRRPASKNRHLGPASRLKRWASGNRMPPSQIAKDQGFRCSSLQQRDPIEPTILPIRNELQVAPRSQRKSDLISVWRLARVLWVRADDCLALARVTRYILRFK